MSLRQCLCRWRAWPWGGAECSLGLDFASGGHRVGFRAGGEQSRRPLGAAARPWEPSRGLFLFLCSWLMAWA